MRERTFEMKTSATQSLLLALVAVLLVIGHLACGGSGYSSPTAPAMQGTPTPGPTPRY